jgi:hypothetical protein
MEPQSSDSPLSHSIQRLSGAKVARPSERERIPAFRERLIDYATTIVYVQPHMQTFPTTCNYMLNMRTGLRMPTRALHSPSSHHGILSAVLSRPLLRALRIKNTSERPKEFARWYNIDREDAVVWWKSPATYGSYATTCLMMAKRQIVAWETKQAARNKSRARQLLLSSTVHLAFSTVIASWRIQKESVR